MPEHGTAESTSTSTTIESAQTPLSGCPARSRRGVASSSDLGCVVMPPLMEAAGSASESRLAELERELDASQQARETLRSVREKSLLALKQLQERRDGKRDAQTPAGSTLEPPRHLPAQPRVSGRSNRKGVEVEAVAAVAARAPPPPQPRGAPAESPGRLTLNPAFDTRLKLKHQAGSMETTVVATMTNEVEATRLVVGAEMMAEMTEVVATEIEAAMTQGREEEVEEQDVQAIETEAMMLERKRMATETRGVVVEAKRVAIVTKITTRDAMSRRKTPDATRHPLGLVRHAEVVETKSSSATDRQTYTGVSRFQPNHSTILPANRDSPCKTRYSCFKLHSPCSICPATGIPLTYLPTAT